MLPVSEPFWEDEEYLVVTDYKQENIYQLKPLSGDLRALPMKSCRPISLAFDPSDSHLYVLCNDTARARYSIQKKTLDDRIGETIYSELQSKLAKNTVFVYCVEIRPYLLLNL